MIEVDDIQETEKKKYPLTRTDHATGQTERVELEFEDAVIELLGSISNSFAMMAAGAAARVQPAGGRRFNVVDPGREN